MKTIIITGLVMSVIGGVLVFVPSSTTVQNIREVVEVEKTIEVNVLENRIQAALEEASASTTAKAQAAYDKVYDQEVKRIEDEVKAAYIAEIEATITSPEY